MAERQVAGHFMAGTLVSLRGQAALGNRFPKRFGNDLPAHFPTEAHPLESPAVAGRETAQLPNLAPVARRQFVHLLPRKTLTVFSFRCEEWVAGFGGSASESLTFVVLSGVAGLLGRRSQPPRRSASRCWRIAWLSPRLKKNHAGFDCRSTNASTNSATLLHRERATFSRHQHRYIPTRTPWGLRSLPTD